MHTKYQNISLIALSGLVATLVALVVYGWHQTSFVDRNGLACENQTIVKTLKIAPCFNYGLYTQVEDAGQ